MSIRIDGLGVHEHSVLGSCAIVGVDVGLCTPRKKLGYAYIHLEGGGDDIRHFFDSFFDTLDKLFVCEWEVIRA